MSEIEIPGTGRQKIVTFVTHLLCLVILFVLPEVLFNYGHPNNHFSAVAYGKAAVFVAVFYIEYYFLLPRVASRKGKIGSFIIFNLILVGAGEFLLYMIMEWARSNFPVGRMRLDADSLLFRQISGVIKDGAMLILTITLAIALRLTDIWIKNDAMRREEENMRRRQELDRLRNQLNPHFLFNTLNSIYAQIAISPIGAQEAVHKLSKLLRHVLYENPVFVSLESEVAFMDNYVKLQQLRLPDSVRMNIDMNLTGYADSRVPSMMFVTILENVYKHADFSEPVSVSLRVDDNSAIFVTKNRIRANRSDSPGIGLENLKRRLYLLFGDKAGFHTEEVDGEFIAVLNVPVDTNS